MEEVKQIRKSYHRLGLGMLLYFLICQFFPVIPFWILQAFFPKLYQMPWTEIVTVEAVQFLIALPVAVCVMKTAPSFAKNPQREQKPQRLNVVSFIQYLFFSLGLMFLFNLVGTGLNTLFSLIKGAPAANLVEQSVSSYSLAQMFLVTVVLAPVGEELLFRKFVYQTIGCYGVKTYVLTSAALFMLMHGNVIQYPYAFAVGLVFAWIYYKTGSLLSTILLHAAVNFIGGVLPFLSVDYPGLLLLLSLMDLAVVAYSAVFAVWRRRFRLKNPTPLSAQQLDAMLLNPGMMLFTLASFLMAGYVILYL